MSFEAVVKQSLMDILLFPNMFMSDCSFQSVQQWNPTYINTMLKELLLSVFLTSVICYIQLPLTANEYSANLQLSIPVQIKGHKAELLLNWGYDDEEIQLPHSISDSDQSSEDNRVLVKFEVESVVRRGIEGFRRNLLQAITFKNKEYMQSVDIEMHYEPTQGTENITGSINLSRSPPYNKVLSRLLGQFEAGRQIFSLYVSHAGSFLQLGGLDSAYSIGKTHVIKCLQAHNWTFAIKSSSFSQTLQGKQNRYSMGPAMGVIIHFEQSYLGVPPYMVNFLIQKLAEDKVHCQLAGHQFVCNNITALQLQKKRLELEVQEGHVIIINLFKIKKQCKVETSQCVLNMRTNPDDFITLGTFMLKEYYMSFDIDSSQILIAMANHFPQKQNLLVFVIRFIFYVVVCITLVLILALLPRLIRILLLVWRRQPSKPMHLQAEQVVSTERDVVV